MTTPPYRPFQHQPAPHSATERAEAEASLSAYQELGPTYQPAVIDSFLDQVEARMGQRAQQHNFALANRPQPPKDFHPTLTVLSLIFAIPLSGIGAGTSGIIGLLVVWIGIVAINLAYAWGKRGKS